MTIPGGYSWTLPTIMGNLLAEAEHLPNLKLQGRNYVAIPAGMFKPTRKAITFTIDALKANGDGTFHGELQEDIHDVEQMLAVVKLLVSQGFSVRVQWGRTADDDSIVARLEAIGAIINNAARGN